MTAFPQPPCWPLRRHETASLYGFFNARAVRGGVASLLRKERLHPGHESIALFTEREVAASFEHGQLGAGNGPVDGPGHGGSDVEVVAAGDHERGESEPRQLRVEVEALEVAPDGLVHVLSI